VLENLAWENNVRDLPEEARRVLELLNAPPRLVAHLILVHDTAADLLRALQAHWRNLPLDEEVVFFGAATHDIGKVLHPGELDGPGSNHEEDGPALLEQLGIPPDRSRFARTHGAWGKEADLALEDLVVALADTCWKGERNEELELLLACRIAGLEGIERWEAFLVLDEIVGVVASRADERLAWQGQFPK
jgi:HD superfamily phosphodiesterase